VRGLHYPPTFCDITQCAHKALVGITHQCFAGKNFKTWISLPLVYTVYIIYWYHITCGDFNICLLGFWPSGAKTLRGQWTCVFYLMGQNVRAEWNWSAIRCFCSANSRSPTIIGLIHTGTGEGGGMENCCSCTYVLGKARYFYFRKRCPQ
jgi:hypothetical protein